MLKIIVVLSVILINWHYCAVSLIDNDVNIWWNFKLSFKRFVREYSIRKFDNCPTKLPIAVGLNFPKTRGDLIQFAGYMEVHEEIPGDIDFALETNRCSLDMKICEKFTTVNVKGVCKTFKEKDKFYSSILATIKPPLECPLKPDNYTAKQAIIDLKHVSLLPIDGYIWLVTLKFVTSSKGSRAKKLIMCVNAEVKIIKTRVQAWQS